MLCSMGSEQILKDQAIVYIIDKDAAIRDSLYVLLSALDICIKTYARAEDFLCEPLRAAPACLITELHLPGMSGLELLRVLRERGIRIPTIVLASVSDVPTAVSAMRAGALDFIDKPFIDRLLLNRVRQALMETSRSG